MDKRIKDFKIVFNKIEKFKTDNPDYNLHFLSPELENASKEIKEFGEICEEISAETNRLTSFSTFS